MIDETFRKTYLEELWERSDSIELRIFDKKGIIKKMYKFFH
jgi:hypothetical protein